MTSDLYIVSSSVISVLAAARISFASLAMLVRLRNVVVVVVVVLFLGNDDDDDDDDDDGVNDGEERLGMSEIPISLLVRFNVSLTSSSFFDFVSLFSSFFSSVLILFNLLVCR